MAFLHEQIIELCQSLNLPVIVNEWLAIAEKNIKEEGSHAELIYQLFKT